MVPEVGCLEGCLAAGGREFALGGRCRATVSAWLGAVLRTSVAIRSLVDVQGAVHAAVRNVDSYHSRPVSIEARAALN
jgi:hypothetical protein